jgi:hypothetical protein
MDRSLFCGGKPGATGLAVLRRRVVSASFLLAGLLVPLVAADEECPEEHTPGSGADRADETLRPDDADVVELQAQSGGCRYVSRGDIRECCADEHGDDSHRHNQP